MYSSSVQIEAVLLSNLLPDSAVNAGKLGQGDPGQAGWHDGYREGMSDTKIKSSSPPPQNLQLRRAREV
jgi:hypothetical protein